MYIYIYIRMYVCIYIINDLQTYTQDTNIKFKAKKI